MSRWGAVRSDRNPAEPGPTALAFPKPAKRGPKPRKPISRSARLSVTGKTPRARDEAEADRLMSRVVRATAVRCQRCGIADRRYLQWAHGFPRRAYPGVKFDFENAFCLCDRCHKYMTHRGAEWEVFMREKLGDQRYDALRQRALINARVDFGPLVIYLRAAAASLGVATEEQWTRWLDGEVA